MANKDLRDKGDKAVWGEGGLEKKVVGIMDFPVYDSNPTSPEGIIQGKVLNNKEVHVIHGADGQTEQRVSGKAKFIFNDTLPHFSIYDGWLTQEDKLSSKGMRVFRWICRNLAKDSDMILLRPSMVARDLGYKTPKSAHDGIFELLKVGAIFRTYGKDPYYYINVNYVFRGKRWKVNQFGLKNDKSIGEQ